MGGLGGFKPVVGADEKPVLEPTGQRKPVASQSEPLRQVVNVPAFYIDRYEFPNDPTADDGAPNMPTHKVTWQQAADMCTDRGKRRCTEEEWEKAKGRLREKKLVNDYLSAVDYLGGNIFVIFSVMVIASPCYCYRSASSFLQQLSSSFVMQAIPIDLFF